MRKVWYSRLAVAGLVVALLQTGFAAEPFDYDAIRNDGAFGKPWSWLSLPGSRAVINPVSKIVNGVPPPLTNLRMDLGYFGTGNKIAEHLQEALTFKIEGVELNPHLTWMPHALQLDAVCEAKGMQVTAADFFADEQTVVRLATVSGARGLSERSWSGRFAGAATQPEPTVVVIEAERYFVAVAVASVSAETGKATPLPLLVKEGQWCVPMPASDSKRETVGVALAFAAKTEGVQAAAAVQRVKQCFQEGSLSERLAGRKAAWRTLLGKVPHVTFGIPAESVSPELHRFYYYGAYSFILSHLMNPLPGSRYPYYSIAEGKPSLWAEGDPLEPAQCSWTCFIVCALLADIYPEEAWSSYEGIMSRVDAEGVLGGECLPSRKAQGGWLLYQATGSRERLQRVYPAIRRYLIWREKNPRWIWGPHDFPDEKDSDFVVSHLIDVGYAIKIAKALGLTDDVAMWQEMTARELGNYRQWFFPADGDPMNFYFTDLKKHTFKDRTKQEFSYILSGLGFEGMPKDLSERLTAYWRKVFDPKQPLAGFDFIKYGESSFIAYGLEDRGMKQDAQQFIDRLLKLTMRPGFDFAEEQRIVNNEVVHCGVLPSLFLAMQVVDFTLIKNGIRIDKGPVTDRK